MLIGVDKHGQVAGAGAFGLELDKEEQILASRLRSGKIYPEPTCDIQVVAHPDGPVLVVRVHPSEARAPGRIEWFADRIEFSNPGGPYGRASEGEFGSFSDYRNPVVTKWLRQLGYVEQLGRGIRLVRKHLDRNGNPPLELETDGFTRVIVRRRA